jgi:hypothetical protein
MQDGNYFMMFLALTTSQPHVWKTKLHIQFALYSVRQDAKVKHQSDKCDVELV